MAIGRFFPSPSEQPQAWLQGKLIANRPSLSTRPATSRNDSDHNEKPNAGEKGAAKETKNQVRHRDKSWSRELV